MKRRDLLRSVGLSAAALGLGRRLWPQPGRPPARSAAFNQTGYLPAAQKVASLPWQDSMSKPGTLNGPEATFELIDRAGKPVLQGKLSDPLLDAASGSRVALADFSAWTKPGIYRISAQGKRSEAFPIGKDAYRKPLRLAMRAFYGQRCGCAVDLGGGFRHAACHAVGAFQPSSGRRGQLANHGGWHDAGDYGRYVVNSGITTGTLLWAWELYPEVLGKLSLEIPESGGKIPDFLAEIRWNLEWMLQLQDEDGGVWHKQTSEQFCGFVMPEKDDKISYVIGTGSAPFKSTCATGDLAAVMAIAARCFAPYDADFAARYLTAAKQAWNWAIAHPEVTFTNPPGVDTGGYGDGHCGDEVFWATAELWRSTGDRQYEQAFLKASAGLPPETAVAVPSWSNLAPMAYWTYLLAGRKGSEALQSRVRKATAAAAEALIGRHAISGYGNTLSIVDYTWGSNAVAANQSLLLLVAHRLQPNPNAVEAALGNLHYLLGRNCFGVSWVTQVGTRPFLHPHHRPSVADGVADPWPGLLSGGPNARPADQVAEALPGLAPMQMWVDDDRAYSVNEVAINWNAPLVFLLAGANAAGL